MTADEIGLLVGSVFSHILIIGTIYYFIKKRAITFSQAVFNRRVITSSLVWLLPLLDRNMTAYESGRLVGSFFSHMLIIGIMYYSIKKRTITLSQAVFNRWVITSSLVWLLLGLAQQNSSHVYPESAVRGFEAGCFDSAEATLDGEVIKKFCSCAILEIQKTYTYGEFKNILAQVQESKTIPSDIRDAMTSCSQRQP